MNNMNNIPHETIEKITKDDVECVEKVIKKLKDYQAQAQSQLENSNTSSLSSTDIKPYV